MDAQLKQRLTGAVILVLLAVLLVPELLRGRGETAPSASTVAAQPTPAEAGDEGAPLRSYEIDLTDEPSAAAEPPDADEAADATPATPTPTPDAAPRAPETAPAASSPSPSPSPATAPVARTPSAAPAPAPSAGLAAPANSGPQRGFAVQVGSFASRDSADRLASQLRSRRFETFVAPVRSGSRQLYRVRVGPVADRAAAQALAARLKSAGQKGSVVPLP